MPVIPLFLYLYSGFALLHAVWIFGNRRSPGTRLKSLIHPNSIRIYLIEVTVVVLQTIWTILFIPSDNPTGLIFSGIGLILFSAGIFIAVWSKIIMRDSWGPPGQLDSSVQRNLVTSGPFAHSRNPIYIGLFLSLLGFSVAIRSPLIFMHILFIVFIRETVPAEEKLLERKYGDAFRQYCRRVPRWIKYI